MKKQYLEAGIIVNTHGVRGEVRIQPWADDAAFLKKFRTLYIDGTAMPVAACRVHKEMAIVRFTGVDDVNTAMVLKGKTVFIHRDDAALPAGHYFLQDILGARVVDEQGAELGALTDILERPAQNVLVVTGDTERLIPMVPEFVLSTDAEAGVITVRLIEGM